MNSTDHSGEKVFDASSITYLPSLRDNHKKREREVINHEIITSLNGTNHLNGNFRQITTMAVLFFYKSPPAWHVSGVDADAKYSYKTTHLI